jgi:phage-related protein
MREIIFYRTESGFCPVQTFLDSITGRQARKIAWVLRLLEDMEIVPEQYFKKLKGYSGLWEVRVECSGEAFRLFGFFHGSTCIVLNHAISKKRQQTPLSDIRLAELRKADYLRRTGSSS